MTERTDGVSALQLQRELGLGSYETAWSLMHRWRRVMALEVRPRLRGEVELGALAVDVVERSGRPFENGSMTVILAARFAAHGRDEVRVAAVPDLTDLQVADFVARSIDAGAALRPTIAFTRRRVDDRRVQPTFARARPRDALPVSSRTLPRLAEYLEHLLAGTLHHGVSSGHLAYYLDEFAFRVNEPAGASRSRYVRLLELAAGADPAPFRDLVGGTADVLAGW
jgi:hypothetical protein